MGENLSRKNVEKVATRSTSRFRKFQRKGAATSTRRRTNAGRLPSRGCQRYIAANLWASTAEFEVRHTRATRPTPPSTYLSGAGGKKGRKKLTFLPQFIQIK